MNTHTHTSTRFVGLALLALGPASPWASAPAGAQQIPWVGLAAPGAQLLGEAGQYPHSPSAADYFGSAVAAGDFNGDGFDDLATGIPGNDCDLLTEECGSVQVRLGGEAAPLGAALVLDPAHPDAPDTAEAFDSYGYAVAAGDFDDDGFVDLAVGVPDNRFFHQGSPRRIGAVQIHYGLDGSLGSIQAAAEHALQDPGWQEFESFGSAVAVGDFDGDGHDDLAVGNPEGIIDGVVSGGRVTVFHGHDDGLVPVDALRLWLGHDGLPDTPEPSEYMGWALAAGDFDGDGFDDLALGVPAEDDAGAVLVVYGSPASLVFPNHWYFDSFDLGGEDQPGMFFGAALAAGDFDADGFDDLAIGAPWFDGQGSPEPEDMGAVSVAYGSEFGLTLLRVHWITEDSLYGAGNGERLDLLGYALAADDFDGDGIDDLAIGAPGEDLETVSALDTGAVSVIPGRLLSGVTGAPRQLRPAVPFDPAGLIPDSPVGGPGYGWALAAGDFDGNGFSDLAIGAPGRDLADPERLDAGVTAVVYGRLFADGFEFGSAGAWSSAAP
jgi:hypothetical protein